MTALPLICVLAFIICVVVGVLKCNPLTQKNGNWKPPEAPRPDPPKGQGVGLQYCRIRRNEAVEEEYNFVYKGYEVTLKLQGVSLEDGMKIVESLADAI